jgi:ABC-2 type transport system permease protein
LSAAIFRIMLLGLLRDRGALAMSFLVPAAFFMIFSAVVSGLGGTQLGLTIGVVNEARSEASARLLRRLGDGASNLLLEEVQAGSESLRDRVRSGDLDIGLILEPNAAPEIPRHIPRLPRARIISDPARGFATLILGGQLQQAYLAVSAAAEPAVKSMAAGNANRSAAQAASPTPQFTTLVVHEEVAGQASGLNHIAYYAGAAAVLFLLFSTVHGAVTLLEEKESGILERLLVGPGSTIVLVNGKFLYLVFQGFVQVAVIFVVAWLAYGVDLPGNLFPWALTTAAAAAAAAGLALALATACSTRQQAQAIANVSILVLSAVGGSMVPRFLMPGWLQDLGWLTPNTWALEAYVDIFWRDRPLEHLLVPWGLLLGAAVLGLVSAQLMARRMESL